MSREDANLELVRSTLVAFRAARSRLESFFEAESTEEVLAAVHEKRFDRNGVLPNGNEYSVHGIGYTVVDDSGGSVHLDDYDDQAESFKVFEIQTYIEETSGLKIDTEVIRVLCDRLLRNGEIGDAGKSGYTLPRGDLV